MALRPRIALIGSGSIAPSYFNSISEHGWADVAVYCNSSGVPAEEFRSKPGLRFVGLDGLLSTSDVEYVINLTPAAIHGEVNRKCLQAGFHVYSEKPLAAFADEAQALIQLSANRNRLLACAPATPLWPSVATAKSLLANDLLGAPVVATAALIYPGPELFHPNPAHLYQPSSGPLLDMGPYYLSALEELLGPVTRVVGAVCTHKAERIHRAGPRNGDRFFAAAPTTWQIALEHSCDATSSLTLSFDAHVATFNGIEICATKGALRLSLPSVPDASLEVSTAPNSWDVVPPDRTSPSFADDFAAGPRISWNEYQRNDPITLSAVSACRHLLVCEAIKRSAEEGRTVHV